MQSPQATGASSGNIWLYHLLKADQREPAMLHVEDEVRADLERVVSRLVAGAYDRNTMELRQANAAAVNLVLQQALDLQRQHSPAAHVPMLRSLICGDPALNGLRDEIGTLARVQAWNEATRNLRPVQKAALWRGASLGVLGCLFVWQAVHLL